MKQGLILIGAGQLGREVYALMQKTQGLPWEILGFLDDDLQALNQFSAKRYPPILGAIQGHQPIKGVDYLCLIASSMTRYKIASEFSAKGARFVNYIHPTAWVSDDAIIGVGNVFSPNVYIATNATVGDYVQLNFCASVGHDSVVGDACTLSAHCDVTGNVKLGSCVFMGSHAAVIPGKKIGDNAIIGAGSVAMRNVPAGATVVGVPAKKLM